MAATPRIFRIGADPTSTDDSTNLSVKAGDIWINTVDNTVFICAVSTPAAAVWERAATDLTEAEEAFLDGVTAGTVTASKAVVVDSSKQINEMQFAVETVTPDDSEGSGNSITAGVRSVAVAAVTNDANDFIVLPAIADVPIGHEILIACNAGGNFELRTPATSGTKINNVDSDGTQEYLCTDTDTVRIWKISDTDGWAAQSLTILGAVRTAVVPD